MTNPIPSPYPYSASNYWKPSVDPDSPGWGPGAALALWGLSVAAIVLLQIPATVVWALEIYVGTGKLPTQEMATSDVRMYLYAVLSTVIAHVLTLAACAVLVRRAAKPGAPRVGFLETFGWEWPDKFKWYHCVAAVFGFYLLGIALSQIIPSRETEFAKLLQKGLSIRIAIAAMAVLTAPLVEEIVYRGVLYGGLRRQFERGQAVALVAFLFLLVHVPQYWGGWDGLTLLALLSIGLTIVRAYTRSLLPCVVIHTLFNLAGAVGILAAGGKR